MKYYLFSNDAPHPFEVEVGGLDMPYLKANLHNIIFSVFESDIMEALSQYDPAPCGFFHAPYELMTNAYAAAHSFLQTRFQNYTLHGRTVDEDGTVSENVLTPKMTDLMADLIQMRAEDNDVVDFDLGPFLIAGLDKFLQKAQWYIGLKRDDNGQMMTDPKSWPTPEETPHGLVWKDGDVLLIPSLWFGLEGQEAANCWTLSQDTGHLTAIGDFWNFDWARILNYYEDTVTVWMFARRGLEEPDTDRIFETCPIPLDEAGVPDNMQADLDRLFQEALAR